MQATKRKPSRQTKSAPAIEASIDETPPSSVQQVVSGGANTLLEDAVNKLPGIDKRNQYSAPLDSDRGSFDFVFANIATALLWIIIGLIVFAIMK